MKSILFAGLAATAALSAIAMVNRTHPQESSPAVSSGPAVADTMKYEAEQFSDIRVLRYSIPGFESLSLKQKELLYYLSEAALCGRDILWDQNYKYNLTIRKTLETIVSSYKGDKKSEDWKKFMVYA